MPDLIRYGDNPSQWGRLYRPVGESRGVVVVIHGGFWKAAYGAELGEPLAARLAEVGWTAWNLEYRRVGNGGGFPATFDDVAAGIDLLADLDVDCSTVVALGHSAGGHLALWAAARGGLGWDDRVPVTHVISQAGVADLTRAFHEDLGSGATRNLMGGASPSDPSYDLADPMRHLPLAVPAWCVHARDDDTVPFVIAQGYVAQARARGATAELVEVLGGHFGVVEPGSPAWLRIEEILVTVHHGR